MTKILIDEATVKLALEALQEVYFGSRSAKHDEAITALREALAEQPAQPYKGIADHTNQVTNGRMRIDPVTGDVGIGTPSPQPAPAPLTNEKGQPLKFWGGKAEQPAQQEIDWKDQYEKQKRRADMWVAKYEADIGLLEKAGPVAAQQEPVAWEQFYPEMGKPKLAYLPPTESTENACYTTPQSAQRTWVGLTDEEIEQGCKESWVTEQAWQSAVWWAEAKLMEKNT